MNGLNELRKLISDIFKSDERDYVLQGIYERRLNDSELVPLFEIIYHTSYAINHFIKITTKTEEVYYKKLNNCKSIEEFIRSMSYNEFCCYCDDVSFFEGCEKYKKKAFLNSALPEKEKISKVSSLYMEDIKLINKVTPISIIMERYNENYEVSKDKAVATEDTICEMIDYLIDLEEDDYDSYHKFFCDVLEVYYNYNKYLMDNNKKVDEYANDIVDKLERDKNGFINYSCANEYAIEPVIRDYISYKLLSEEERKKINDYSIRNGEYNVFNPNSLVRKFLSEVFSGLSVANEDCIYKFKDELNVIKKDKDIFDLIAPVLYLDDYTYNLNEHINFPNNTTKINVDFIKSFNNLSEYKQYLIEDDYNFLNTIYKSLYYNCGPITTKKSIIINMFNDDCYEDCITDNYLFDVLEYYREYRMKDVYNIFNTEYSYDNDPEGAAIRSSQSLANELLDIRLLDEDNYKRIMNVICKNFYAYEKYKIKNKDKSVGDFDGALLKDMDKNIDTFINEIVGEYGKLIYMLQIFYEYNSLPMYEISRVNEYIDNNLNNNKVIKILNQKIKNPI